MIGTGEGCSGVTYKGKFPTTNYELSLEAMRVDGSDFFCGLTFPVKPAADHPRLDPEKKDEVWPCTLVIGGWGGGVLGLSSIDGNDASENSTSQYKTFESGQWYKVRLRVTEKKVEAWLDKEKVIDLTIGHRKLSVRIEVEESKPLGIATWRTTGAVRGVRDRARLRAGRPAGDRGSISGVWRVQSGLLYPYPSCSTLHFPATTTASVVAICRGA